MIDEALLRSAAAKSLEKHVAAVEANLVPMEPHVFSEKFERKIRKLTKRANHPVLYHAVKRVASVLLAIILAGSVWLVVDVDARAAFVGWVKEKVETFFIYKYIGEVEDSKPAKYHMTYVPDGYTAVISEVSDTEGNWLYINNAGQYLQFAYVSDPNDSSILVGVGETLHHKVYVNNHPAEFYESTDAKISSALIWNDDLNRSFYLSGFFDRSELIKIAENIKIQK